MTKDKDLKRLVRARMQKTGESYTTARSQVVDRGDTSSANSPEPLPASRPIPVGYERVAGMSDDAVEAKTGRTWPEWVWVLDGAGADAMEHRDIASHVHETYDVTSWWSQTITVGYERLRGLRDVGQRRGGSYEVNKSKTVGVPVGDLFRAFADAAERGRWLPDLEPDLRAVRENKSLRMGLPDGTVVAVYFTEKSEAKSSVSLQHQKLPGKDAAASTREFWTERLGALFDLLTAD